jgi:rSAM/selenodomain-associated transferase 2
MSESSLTVIIPVLNEADRLPALLSALREQRGLDIETIVADGGSHDDSARIAAYFNVQIIHADRGRGRQMNAAARVALGEYLLFLHADSSIDDPELLFKAVAALRDEFKRQKGEVAGHFRLNFQRTSKGSRIAYRYLEEKTALNRVNTTNGDQGLLITKSFFRSLSGFDESLPFLEDQRLAERIRARGRWITLPGVLGTSARRFEVEGFYRRYILMGIIMGLHSTDVHPFFRRAGNVYRSQTDTGRLLLTPFFRMIWRMLQEDLGWWGSLRTWFHVGRYVRQNAWQIFFFFDVLMRPIMGPGRNPFLAIHDRVFRPVTDFRFFDGITAVGSFLWYMGILAPWFWVVERGDPGYYQE